MLTSRFDFHPTPLSGLILVQRKIVADARGFLSRLFGDEEFGAAGLGKTIVQISHTLTRNKGAVRGMHYQHPPYAEIKLVNCLRGKVFDVAVDLRKGSPTFLQWHAEILSAENNKGLLIPEGFAHGFQALADDCELLYCHTAEYHPEAEGGLHVGDPRLAITWPLPFQDMSSRDLTHPYLAADYEGIGL